MRKQRRKPKKAPAQAENVNVRFDPGPKDPGKRATLNKLTNWGLGAAVVGGFGFWSVGTVRARMDEGDLTKVGQGVPTVVQIHNPQCSVCASLMRETRSALSTFEDGEIDYLVANIRTRKGRDFAALYDVPNITLLLFDGEGNLLETLEGLRQDDELRAAFSTLLTPTS